VLLLFLGLPSLALANREICGAPPPEQFREENNESIKGELAGKANFLSSYVGKADLGGKIEATRKEIFSKYSDANAAYMDRYLAYMFCLVLFDPKNQQNPEDKIKAIQEFKRQQQPRSSIEDAKELPDVALRFVYPKSPALVLVNQSAVLARDIQWFVLLWNTDLPDRDNPLPIPISEFRFLRPHEQGGPQNLFSSPSVAPLLEPGNRLFGSASVICPECARGRTYIVYIVWNEGGWFSEVEDVKFGTPFEPLNSNFSKEGRIAHFNALEMWAPAQSRTPIK
jgi:hypothetical protein